MDFDFSGLADPTKGSAAVVVKNAWDTPVDSMIFNNSFTMYQFNLLANSLSEDTYWA
jgi:hypothetical protein